MCVERVSNISEQVDIFIIFLTLLFKEVSPVINVTLAPILYATSAIAYPILPLERLVINLTGSIYSFVGPAVTIIFTPLSISLGIS